MKATIEVLSDSELQEQISKSKEDIKKGRVGKWNVFLKNYESFVFIQTFKVIKSWCNTPRIIK